VAVKRSDPRAAQ